MRVRPPTQSNHRRIWSGFICCVLVITGCGTADVGSGNDTTVAPSDTAGGGAAKNTVDEETNTTVASSTESTPGSADVGPSSTDVEDSADSQAQGPVTEGDATSPATVVPVEITGVDRLKQIGADVELGAGDRVIGVDLNATKVTDRDLVHLAELNDLNTLNLSRTTVTDKGLEEIAKLRRLKFLYLYGAGVTDEGVKHIAELDRLEVLCLDDTRITNKSLKLLGEMKRLEKLHIQTKETMTDEGLMELVGLTRLFELRIPFSEITDEAVQEFRKKLPRCRVSRPEAKPEDDEEPSD